MAVIRSILISFAALVLSPVLASAQSSPTQTRPPRHVCVIADGKAPDCIGDPIPSILEDADPAAPRRSYRYQGDGPVVPFRSAR